MHARASQHRLPPPGPTAPQTGQAVQLSGTGSQVGVGRSVKTYHWSLVSDGGIVSGFSSATNASTAALAATTAPGNITVRLTVSDDFDLSASTDASIAVAAVPAPVPTTPTPNSGGGGGVFSLGWLLGLVLATLGLSVGRMRIWLRLGRSV